MAGSIQFLEMSLQCSSLALIYYDYLITLNREIRYVWQRPFAPMTIAFAFCRYSLVANISFLVGLFNKYHHTRTDGGSSIVFISFQCDDLYLFSAVLSVLGRIGVMAILGGRACSVWQGNRYVVLLFSVLGCAVSLAAMLHVPRVSCSGLKIQENRIGTRPTPVLFKLSNSGINFDSLRVVKRDGLIMLLLKEGAPQTSRLCYRTYSYGPLAELCRPSRIILAKAPKRFPDSDIRNDVCTFSSPRPRMGRVEPETSLFRRTSGG
ncbi:hypothetical protein CC2G_007876 [Coprinopsis cinerea AmutBmut pab1-1]|nr:hypothetical protein CC2G_007876 [Coprinopsis cinerea AmutBmut pab1-1]